MRSEKEIRDALEWWQNARDSAKPEKLEDYTIMAVGEGIVGALEWVLGGDIGDIAAEVQKRLGLFIRKTEGS